MHSMGCGIIQNRNRCLFGTGGCLEQDAARGHNSIFHSKIQTQKMPASRQARSATRCSQPYGLSQSQLDLLQENKSLKATAAKLTERCTKIRASKIRLRARCLRRAGTTDGRIEELERQLKHAQDRNHLLAKAWNEVKRVEGLPHRAFRTKFNYALGGDFTKLTDALETLRTQWPNLVLHRANPLA